MRPMRGTLTIAGIACALAPLCGLPASAGTSQPLPTPFPETRYRQMTTRSPFAVATAAAPQAAATPGFAVDLYVDGVAHLGQTDFVAIKSRDMSKPVAMFVAVGDSTADGMRVDGIRWSDETGKSTVDVSKAGEKATLQFDGATMQQSAGAPMADTRMRFPLFNQADYTDEGNVHPPPTHPLGRAFPFQRFPIRGNR